MEPERLGAHGSAQGTPEGALRPPPSPPPRSHVALTQLPPQHTHSHHWHLFVKSRHHLPTPGAGSGELTATRGPRVTGGDAARWAQEPGPAAREHQATRQGPLHSCILHCSPEWPWGPGNWGSSAAVAGEPGDSPSSADELRVQGPRGPASRGTRVVSQTLCSGAERPPRALAPGES